MVRSAIVASLAIATAAGADFDPDAYPRHETCALCHGLFGESHNGKFPHLAGQDATYIETQLRAFLSGSRSNDGGQMAAIVTELQPGDIEQVVAWFASQDPPAAAPAPETDAGRDQFSNLGCPACHTPSPEPGIPHLTAQQSSYLAKQMRDFRDEFRAHPDVAPMHRDLLQLPDAQLQEIADYLASQERGS